MKQEEPLWIVFLRMSHALAGGILMALLARRLAPELNETWEGFWLAVAAFWFAVGLVSR